MFDRFSIGAKMLCYLAATSPEVDLGGSGMDLGWISGCGVGFDRFSIDFRRTRYGPIVT